MNEKVLRHLQCCFKSNHSHIAREPVALKCNSICCRECFQRGVRQNNMLYCLKCNQSHSCEASDQPVMNELFDLFISENLNDLFTYAENKYAKDLMKFDDLNSQLEENISQVRIQLNKEYEKKKQELDYCFFDLSSKLDAFEKRNDGFSKGVFDKIEEFSTRENILVKDVDFFYRYQALVIKTLESLEETKDNLAKIEFIPNEAVRLSEELIGQLRECGKLMRKAEKRHSGSIDDHGSLKVRAIDLHSTSATADCFPSAEPVVINAISPERSAAVDANMIEAMTDQSPYARQKTISRLNRIIQPSHDESLENEDPSESNLNTTFITDISQKDLTGEVCIAYKTNEAFDLPRLTEPHNNTLYFTDFRNNLINAFNIETGEIVSSGPLDGLQKPYPIAVDKIRNRLFVGKCPESSEDPNGFCVYVLDLNKNFEVIKRFGHGRISEFDSIEYDSHLDHLYVSTPEYNEVTVWNVGSGTCIHEFDITTPATIRIVDDFIFIASFTQGTFKKTKSTAKGSRDQREKWKLVTTKRGENCIFILNKTNLEEVRRIQLNDWFNPRGLYIDPDLNVLTTAITLDAKKFVTTESLYCFNFNGELLRRIPLKYDNVFDFQVYNNNDETKIVLIRGDDEPSLVVYNFM